MRGVLSGVAGRRPVAVSSSSSSSTPGTIARASHEQFVHGARPHRGVGPPLLDRGADDDRAVPAGHQVHRAAVHQAAHGARQQCDGRRGVGRPEAKDVPLDGAQGGQPRPGEPVDGAQSRAGRQDDEVRAEAAAVRQDERGPVVERGDACSRRRSPRRRGKPRRALRGAPGCRPGGRPGPRCRRAGPD